MFRFSLVAVLLAASALSPAQNLDDSDYRLSVEVQLVQLPVSVLDRQGLPVRNLERESFTVYEDKVLQNISLFKQEDVPLSVALVVDASSSMLDKQDRLHTAAMTFVRESHPEDETSIVSFGDNVFLEEDFTQDTRELSRALTGIRSEGNTALYDAVSLAANHLQHNGSYEKKVLLIISDGQDNRSKYNLEQVLKTVGESKVIVYAIGIVSSDSSTYAIPGDTGKKALKRLAEVTGGASFFPKNVNDVERISVKIARDLRNQYTIGYRPANPLLDGSWRKVVVRIKPPKNAPNLKVRTKQGYYAPAAKRDPGQGITKK